MRGTSSLPLRVTDTDYSLCQDRDLCVYNIRVSKTRPIIILILLYDKYDRKEILKEKFRKHLRSYNVECFFPRKNTFQLN